MFSRQNNFLPSFHFLNYICKNLNVHEYPKSNNNFVLTTNHFQTSTNVQQYPAKERSVSTLMAAIVATARQAIDWTATIVQVRGKYLLDRNIRYISIKRKIGLYRCRRVRRERALQRELHQHGWLISMQLLAGIQATRR